MAVLLSFSQKPLTVTAVGPPNKGEWVEVFGFSHLSMSLRLLGVDDPNVGGFSVAIDLETAMTPTGAYWLPAVSFGVLSSAPVAAMVLVERPLRYLRWNVTTLSGCTAAHFQLDGVAWTS